MVQIDHADWTQAPQRLNVHALNGQITKEVTGPFLLYVNPGKVFGGSLGIDVVVPFVNQCGVLFAGDSDRCSIGMGDPYVEIDWSRSFGTLRPSVEPGAYPILQGLFVLLGLGAVIPLGNYNSSDLTERALSTVTNNRDVAPSIALTYTTAPIRIEGTKFCCKLFWNNYFENPETQYSAGDLLNLDFAACNGGKYPGCTIRICIESKSAIKCEAPISVSATCPRRLWAAHNDRVLSERSDKKAPGLQMLQ